MSTTELDALLERLYSSKLGGGALSVLREVGGAG